MLSITELLKEWNVPIAPDDHHHRTAGREQIDCPWCSKDSHKWRLGISYSGRYGSCWTCGRIDVVETLAEAAELHYRDVRKALAGIESFAPIRRDKTRGTLVLPDGIQEMTRAHRKYLKGRGFDPDEVETLWDVKGIGEELKYAWRLFIPIYCQGEMLSWSTRSLCDYGVRYVNAPIAHEACPAKHLLYGMDYAHSKSVIVHEGFTDVWATGPGAVGVMGLSYSKEQVLLLSSFERRAICFDNERAAQKRARKLCNQLSVFEGETFLVCLKAKDSGSANRKEIRELRKRFLE